MTSIGTRHDALLAKAAWLRDQLVQDLFRALTDAGGEARVVGGAIRNTLLGEPVGDIDFATTLLPDETVAALERAGFKAVPTGIDHGTIMAVRDGRGFEITTLRTDVATDGRHAEVAFGTDWITDAQRRDFTINALYCDADGTVHDFVGGLADLDARMLRFIGDADARITEDYLRILRFFRFFAWYGDGRPHADGLRAAARHKSGLAQLSAERVWAELRKLLSAPDPSRALLWMRQTGVLTAILPESEKWGIDLIQPLVEAEAALGDKPDPQLRLMAITPDREESRVALCRRLKVSNAERDRLVSHAMQAAIDPGVSEMTLARLLYFGDPVAIRDRLLMAYAAERAAQGPIDPAVLARLAAVRFATDYVRPEFPLSGRMLIDQGAAPGPKFGHVLKTVETEWADGGFKADRDALLTRALELLAKT